MQALNPPILYPFSDKLAAIPRINALVVPTSSSTGASSPKPTMNGLSKPSE